MQITLTKEQVREAFGELRYMGADYCYKYDKETRKKTEEVEALKLHLGSMKLGNSVDIRLEATELPKVWMMAVLFPLGMKYYERMIRQAEEKGKRRFERQFQDALQSLEAQLNVGYSMENAIKEVQRDLQIMYDRHTLIVREFTYMVRQLNLNVTAEAAWKDFAARVALPEVDTFVTVFSLAKRSGGDSILIIKNAVRQLGDKAEVTAMSQITGIVIILHYHAAD